jgi:hypothetical protein
MKPCYISSISSVPCDVGFFNLLQGLAMSASSILGTYSCGLWLKTIAHDLLWRVPLLEPGYGRPTAFTGPSWSWASVNRQVVYWNDLNYHVEDDETERLRYNRLAHGALYYLYTPHRESPPKLEASCEVNLTGENPFGQVNSGLLKITGLVRNAKLLYVSSYGSALSTHVDTHDPLRYRLDIQTSGYWTGTQTFPIELPFFRGLHSERRST